MIGFRALAAALLITAGTPPLAGSAGVADHTNYYLLSPMPAEAGNLVPAAASSPEAVATSAGRALYFGGLACLPAVTPSRSAMRTSSANVLACIFRMI